MDKIKEIEKLILELNNASDNYYNGIESMSNIEWDEKFDRLKQLEASAGIVPENSPTKNVGYESKAGSRVILEYPAKSLDKTKDINTMLSKMQGEKDLILMWKLDGGTLQLTYNRGKLLQVATRGNGEVGQNITANSKAIKGIPQEIEYKGKLVLRGEAVMSYEDFYGINDTLPDEERYANPRNLANATISMLDIDEVRGRNICVKIFSLVYIDDNIDLFDKRMNWLKEQGFNTVEWEHVTEADLKDKIENWTKRVREFSYPVDGLVIASNNIGKAETLAGTEHHPNPLAGFAFKWRDKEAKTVLREIEWSASRTGLLNPIAVFDTVELEGTKVSRASLHNFSYVLDKHLRIGDEITVYKANMIIPQVRDNLSENISKFSKAEIEEMTPVCPVCRQRGSLYEINGIFTMRCDNSSCAAKMIGKFVHFCSRNSMDIEGLSEATITKFIKLGFILNFSDLYKLDRHRENIIAMEGFGEKSFDNLQRAINNSKTKDVVSFLTAIGIPGVGRGQAKLIAAHFNGRAEEIIKEIFNKTEAAYDFTVIDGIGEVINANIHRFNGDILGNVLDYLSLGDIKTATNTSSAIGGKVFVITGSLKGYENRNVLKEYIESMGGKVTGSVTGKTDYLINNNINSASGKNKTAKELNIPIITEDGFNKLAGKV